MSGILTVDSDINPCQGTTPRSTMSSSTFLSLPTTPTVSAGNLELPGNDSVLSIGNRSVSITSMGSSLATDVTITRQFCITPPPPLPLDGLRSATTSACHTPRIAPEPFAVAPVCQDLPCLITNFDDEDVGLEWVEEKTDQRFPHRRNASVWTLSGDFDGEDEVVSPQITMHRSRPSNLGVWFDEVVNDSEILEPPSLGRSRDEREVDGASDDVDSPVDSWSQSEPSLKLVYLDSEVYFDDAEPTPRSTASEELREERRANYDKKFCFDEYQTLDHPLMKHYMKLVREVHDLSDSEMEASEMGDFRLTPHSLQYST